MAAPIPLLAPVIMILAMYCERMDNPGQTVSCHSGSGVVFWRRFVSQHVPLVVSTVTNIPAIAFEVVGERAA